MYVTPTYGWRKKFTGVPDFSSNVERWIWRTLRLGNITTAWTQVSGLRLRADTLNKDDLTPNVVFSWPPYYILFPSPKQKKNLLITRINYYACTTQKVYIQLIADWAFIRL